MKNRRRRSPKCSAQYAKKKRAEYEQIGVAYLADAHGLLLNEVDPLETEEQEQLAELDECRIVNAVRAQTRKRQVARGIFLDR